MSQNVLIIGYGKMGRIHGKYLDEMGLKWDYVDKNISHRRCWPKYLEYYTHIIVATPIDTHEEVYDRLLAYDGLILIEKPVTIYRDRLDILKDVRVLAGLNERYNPATHYLQSVQDQIKLIDFHRDGCGDFHDACIHDIDIAFQIFGTDYTITKFDTSRVEARFNGILVTFSCNPNGEKERYANVIFDNGLTTVDFKNQEVNNAPLKNCFTVKEQLKNFMRGYFGEDEWDKEPISYHSHKFLVECLEHGTG